MGHGHIHVKPHTKKVLTLSLCLLSSIRSPFLALSFMFGRVRARRSSLLTFLYREVGVLLALVTRFLHLRLTKPLSFCAMDEFAGA